MDAITHLADLGYLVAAMLFILGIKGLLARTAVRGNQLGAAGMFLVILITVAQMQAEPVTPGSSGASSARASRPAALSGC